MDSMTHVYLAARLLATADEDARAIDCALFPQIDRRPAYYHRLYTHSVAKAAPVVVAARSAYWNEMSDDLTPSYFTERLAEDADRIRRYAKASPFFIDAEGAPPTTAQYLAFVSHLYNDQFNNPIQAFAPFSVYPSGAWKLWESIGTDDFRWNIYEKAAITELRENVFSGAEWDSRMSAAALTAAMISRLAGSSAVAIPVEAVVAALESVGVGDLYGTVEIKEAEELLAEHEARLAEAIARFARRAPTSARRTWAGEGI